MTAGELVLSMGVSLGLTLLIELGLGLICEKRGRTLKLIGAANLLTNPAVAAASLVIKYCTDVPRWPAVLLMEVAAAAIEGMVYRIHGDFSRPYGFSFGANALSYGAGIIIQSIF